MYAFDLVSPVRCSGQLPAIPAMGVGSNRKDSPAPGTSDSCSNHRSVSNESRKCNISTRVCPLSIVVEVQIDYVVGGLLVQGSIADGPTPIL